jgi:hypothetical protein
MRVRLLQEDDIIQLIAWPSVAPVAVRNAIFCEVVVLVR